MGFLTNSNEILTRAFGKVEASIKDKTKQGFQWLSGLQIPIPLFNLY